MRFEEPLIECVFIKRYKRFLVDVELADGEIITVHCPNSGSMKGCQPEGGRAWISDSKNPKRKLRHTLEILEIDGVLVCVNTQRPNALMEEGIRLGVIDELQDYTELKREVRYGTEKSRIDILLTRGDERCYVEVKNVTLGGPDGVNQFPDAVTSRGTKHLRELMAMVSEGHRAVLLFCGSRADVKVIEPADEIDPVYGQTLREAANAGVELLAYALDVQPDELRVSHAVPVRLPN